MENIPLPEKSFEKMAALKASAAAQSIIRERFETAADLDDREAYHNWDHTEGVLRRADEIAKALELDSRTSLLVTIAASFHDTVQKWDPKAENGTIERKRRRGANERESADEAVAWMQAQSEPAFTEAECEQVRTAILATVPAWDSDRATMYYPALTKDTDIIARTLALADIGTSGMEPETFAAEGDQIFAEEQLDITEAIRKSARDGSSIDEAQQASFLSRYQSWLDNQVLYARGRKEYFELEIEGLPELQRCAVLKLLIHSDESIARVEEKAMSAKRWNFQDMVAQLQKSVPARIELF